MTFMVNNESDWKTDLLVHPQDGCELTGKWPLLKSLNGIPLGIDDLGVVTTEVSMNAGLQFHLLMDHGVALRELQRQHLHLAYWETPYYKEAIAAFLKDINPRQKTAIDVGCGDGRFTEQLVDLGFDRIIATDIDVRPLRMLAKYAEGCGFRDKLLLIQCSADAFPLKQNAVDVALCIGVLYYLNDRFETGLQRVASLVRPGGLFIDSEPDLEGALLKAILFENLGDYVCAFREHTFTETCKGEKTRFRLFSQDEVRAHYRGAGLEVLDLHGLSLFPSILRIAMVRGQISKDQVAENEANIRKSFDYLNRTGGVYKHIIWKCKKGVQCDCHRAD